MLSIHVISLKNASTRRRSINQQFRQIGLEFSYFDAFDGSKLTNKSAARIDRDQFLLNTGRSPSNGEIACFLSHRELWKKCVEQGRALIILEDDCMLQESFMDAVALPISSILDMGIIRLQSENKPCKYPIYAYSGTTFWRYTKVPFGACAYILSPAAAQKLIDASEFITAPVDSFMKMPWLFDQPVHAMTPYAIELSPLSHDSQIKDRVRANRSVGLMLRRPMYKAANWIKRFIFNRKQLKQAVQEFASNEDPGQQVTL